MIPNKEEYEIIREEVKNYDIENPKLPDELYCSLFPNIDLLKVCKFLKFFPHPIQTYMLKNLKRFSVINVWRQSWKSEIAALLMILASMSKQNWEYMIVSVDHAASKIIVDKLLKLTHWIKWGDWKDLFLYQKKDNILIFKPTNSRIHIKSAKNETSLVWLTLDGILVDEAAYISSDIIQQKLPATITVKKWFMLYTSTPLTENDVFYTMFKKGQAEPWDYNYDEERISFHFTSYDSPYQDPTYLDKEKANNTEATYRQQYLAMPLTDWGSVYKNIKECATWEEREPEIWKHRYVMGWDIAALYDWSVFIVFDRKTKSVVHINRFTWMEWEEQIDLCLDTAEKYNHSPIFMDASVWWWPVLEWLLKRAYERHMSLYIEWVTQTTKTKPKLVQELAKALETKTISYPNNPILLKELEEYKSKVLENWHIKYSAPRRWTDDMVSAMQIAYFGLQKLWPYVYDLQVRWQQAMIRNNYKNIY